MKQSSKPSQAKLEAQSTELDKLEKNNNAAGLLDNCDQGANLQHRRSPE